MNRLFLICLALVVTFFTYHQISFAACGGATPNFFCDDSPPNPDPTGIQEEFNDNTLNVNILPGAAVDTVSGNGGSAIDLGHGGNTITVDNANLIGDKDAVNAGFGNDMVDIISSDLTASDDCIDTTSGNDIVNMTDSTCSAVGNGGEGMELSSGNDTVSVLRSTILCNPSTSSCEAIDASSGRDNVTVVESTLRGGGPDPEAIALSTGDDTATLGTGADLEGIIDCSSGFDTIVFAMDVPPERLNFFSNQIALAGLPDGSITINGLFYEWNDCELLVNELVGLQMTRPIPTLSEWGLIAMAGILGLAGFIAIRKNYVTS